MDAADIRLQVAITFHFVSSRLGYLEEVLRSLTAFPIRELDICIFTNTAEPAAHRAIESVFKSLHCVCECHARIVVVTGLAHPHNLTWSHKDLISAEFLAPASRFTHFAYVEDDEPLSIVNLKYFVLARELLRPYRMVPSLLRTEWSSSLGALVNADHTVSVNLVDRPFIPMGEYSFINPDNPYCGSFMLDRELGEEYVASASFDMDRSRGVCPWGVRERAAMGMSFVAPPKPFLNRVAVPVLNTTKVAPQFAWLPHLPNNYAEDASSMFGKVPMDGLFTGQFNPTYVQLDGVPLAQKLRSYGLSR